MNEELRAKLAKLAEEEDGGGKWNALPSEVQGVKQAYDSQF